MDAVKPLLSIVGPTASGKSALAMRIATKYNGEIICADSRTIYKGMDIGTAKPTPGDRTKVPHHCLDLVEPNQRYSVAKFKEEAGCAVEDIKQRQKLPILVGGSGLYIDSVLYDFDFGQRSEVKVEGMDLNKLQRLAQDRGLSPSLQTLQNKRHLASFIIRGGDSSKKPLKPGTILIGMQVEKEVINERIRRRVEAMFRTGLVEEINSLLEKYGENAPGFDTPGYRPMISFVQGKLSEEEAKQMFIRNDNQLAKRQMTWFKRNKDIQWASTAEVAEQLIERKLRSFATI